MNSDAPSRDEICLEYLEKLPFQPYPLQEQALSAWFDAAEGVLVCAPTGTGKTVIAEAALFEALRTGRRAYYTTPLIALCEQKFRELQMKAVEWGFFPEDVGLVTGNRRVNPDAPIIVAVAEILCNRLLDRAGFAFDDVASVVMDEFHSFNDPERGIVWELTLSLLPKHIRLLLLSATVGNAYEFVAWLRNAHDRRIELVQGTERRVPLTCSWVGDQLLPELLESMTEGDEEDRLTPGLVFCFNRDQCWDVAEQMCGRSLLSDHHRAKLADELAKYRLETGIGPKLRRLLQRGVGVHHAGVLPKYRRIVEDLFQKKLLAFTTCTETLAAGINLPARSVVLPTLMKGPKGKKKLLDPSTAHQIFGRAGRPQFDSQGFVFALAHEDDVRLERWREKYDRIPDNTKDPVLRKAKKSMKKKQPKRSATEQYWTESQFLKLWDAKPVNLASRGKFPWRLLAWLLEFSPDVEKIRDVVRRRLMDGAEKEVALRELDRMLLTLGNAGLVRLEPAAMCDSGLPLRDDAENPLPMVADLSAGKDMNDYEATLDAAWSAVPKTRLLQVRRAAEPIEPLMNLAWYRSPESLSPHVVAADATSPAVEAPVSGPPPKVDPWATLGDLLDDEMGGDGNSAVAARKNAPQPDGESETPTDEPTAEPAMEPTNEAADASDGRNVDVADEEPQDEASSETPEEFEADESIADDDGSIVEIVWRNSDARPDEGKAKPGDVNRSSSTPPSDPLENWSPQQAWSAPELSIFVDFRSVNPLYGMFLLSHLGIADREERLQVIESVLEMPVTVARMLRVPRQDSLPPGPLAMNRINPTLLERGLATIDELMYIPRDDEEDFHGFRSYEERPRWVLTLAEKVYRLFDADYPNVHSVTIVPVRVAAELLRFRDFDRFITSYGLQKQEGMVFRHILRLILLLDEFYAFVPPDTTESEWRGDLEEVMMQLTDICRRVDPSSTEEMLSRADQSR